MKDRTNYMVGSPADFVFGPPSDEVLRATVVESNEDLTLHGPGGELRLTAGTATWKRYRGYLDDLAKLDDDARTCEGYQPWATLTDEERAEYEVDET